MCHNCSGGIGRTTNTQTNEQKPDETVKPAEQLAVIRDSCFLCLSFSVSLSLSLFLCLSFSLFLSLSLSKREYQNVSTPTFTIFHPLTGSQGIIFPFIRSGQNHIARHSERGKKTRRTKEEVGRQHQGMDRPGVRQVPESSREQGKMEKTDCKIICGAPTTLAVKGLMMMIAKRTPCSNLLKTKTTVQTTNFNQ